MSFLNRTRPIATRRTGEKIQNAAAYASALGIPQYAKWCEIFRHTLPGLTKTRKPTEAKIQSADESAQTRKNVERFHHHAARTTEAFPALGMSILPCSPSPTTKHRTSNPEKSSILVRNCSG